MHWSQRKNLDLFSVNRFWKKKLVLGKNLRMENWLGDTLYLLSFPQWEARSPSLRKMYLCNLYRTIGIIIRYLYCMLLISIAWQLERGNLHSGYQDKWWLQDAAAIISIGNLRNRKYCILYTVLLNYFSLGKIGWHCENHLYRLLILYLASK